MVICATLFAADVGQNRKTTKAIETGKTNKNVSYSFAFNKIVVN